MSTDVYSVGSGEKCCSSSDSSNGMPEDWEDWENDGWETDRVQCLFSDDTFESIDEAIAHDNEKNGFSFEEYREKMRMSFYDTLCVINFIRGERLQGRDPRGHLEAVQSSQGAPWKDEKYLIPVIENDPMLLHSWEELEVPSGQVDGGESGAFDDDIAKDLLEGLDLNDPSLRELLRQQGVASKDGATGRLGNVGDSSEVNTVLTDAEDIDQQYFESYSFMDIHREMLEDKVRTNTYRSVLENNQGLMSGAAVLDVGCGTGVLSIFAARGGASKVVAVDGSPAISNVAESIFIRNGYSSEQNGMIKVLSTKIENLESLGDIDKVDVIVSEWMGYALLFESMLDSVLLARDRFLKPGGAMLPDVANIYVALGSREAEGLSFWSNVYDIDMSLVARSLRDYYLSHATVRNVNASDVVSNVHLLHRLDLAEMKREEQDFCSPFELVLNNESEVEGSCILLWFDTEFSSRFCTENPQTLSTGPFTAPTHWAQTVLPLPEAINHGQMESNRRVIGINGTISMSRQKQQHRTLDIVLEYGSLYDDGTHGQKMSHLYSIGVRM